MADWTCGICGEGNMQDDSVCKGGERHRNAVAERDVKIRGNLAEQTAGEVASELRGIAQFLTDLRARLVVLEAAARLRALDGERIEGTAYSHGDGHVVFVKESGLRIAIKHGPATLILHTRSPSDE